MNLSGLKNAVSVIGGKIQIHDNDALRKTMDELVFQAVFAESDDAKRDLLIFIKEAAKAAGAFPASIQGLYEELGREYRGSPYLQ